ncbi:MAG: tRNA (adenosine(37)-N6)-threonylcarbamoyltransferase complex dimerization subunit type 1 TsaB [Gammaproteobacteria bacterium]|nr:MAG: tRNA (adenosine(37)-N6)-threonylcarbamoyltransferase complex dimerization subunit type 1 TsaB [Gammaproteobacteria bacterium]
MSKILAIDSSTEACSVALLLDGKVFKRFQLAPRKHAELLLPMVDDILKQADVSLVELDAIACCVGPGAFTGLRIAVSVAQGLAFASNLPCIAFSSLEMLAIRAFKKTKANICLSAIDARMKEVYFAIFERLDDGNAKLVGSERVIDPLEIEFRNWDINAQAVKIGNGWSEYEFNHSIKQLNTIELLDQFPHAVDMLDIAESALNANKLLKPELLQPIYIRNNVAKKKLVKK